MILHRKTSSARSCSSRILAEHPPPSSSKSKRLTRKGTSSDASPYLGLTTSRYALQPIFGIVKPKAFRIIEVSRFPRPSVVGTENIEDAIVLKHFNRFSPKKPFAIKWSEKINQNQGIVKRQIRIVAKRDAVDDCETSGEAESSHPGNFHHTRGDGTGSDDSDDNEDTPADSEIQCRKSGQQSAAQPVLAQKKTSFDPNVPDIGADNHNMKAVLWGACELRGRLRCARRCSVTS